MPKKVPKDIEETILDLFYAGVPAKEIFEYVNTSLGFSLTIQAIYKRVSKL